MRRSLAVAASTASLALVGSGGVALAGDDFTPTPTPTTTNAQSALANYLRDNSNRVLVRRSRLIGAPQIACVQRDEATARFACIFKVNLLQRLFLRNHHWDYAAPTLQDEDNWRQGKDDTEDDTVQPVSAASVKRRHGQPAPTQQNRRFRIRLRAFQCIGAAAVTGDSLSNLQVRIVHRDCGRLLRTRAL